MYYVSLDRGVGGIIIIMQLYVGRARLGGGVTFTIPLRGKWSGGKWSGGFSCASGMQSSIFIRLRALISNEWANYQYY